MASGGHNNQNNPPGRNPPPPAGGQWNVNRARKDDGDHWNQTRRNISNNLSLQDWQPVKKDTQNKNERRSKLGKNTYAQKVPSDSIEVVHGFGEIPSQSVPRTKFTTGSSVPHCSMNGARRKVVHRDRGSSGDANERGNLDPKWDDRSKSGQTGSRSIVKTEGEPPTKDKFANLPNANQIMVRLHQIRDYMSQVASMIETLQKSDDPQVVDRLAKLEGVLGDLQYSEHQLVELLDKVSRNNRGQIIKFSRMLNHLQAQEHEYVNILQNMALRPENGIPAPENESDVTSEESDEESEESLAQEENSETSERLDKEAEEQNAEEDHILRRNELMKKMLESQEKLKALQDQQAALLSLQHKAENRLAEARAFRNQLMDNPKDGGEAAPPPCPVDIQTNSSNVLQDDLENLQERLNVLRDMYDNRQRAESLSRSGDSYQLKEPEEIDETGTKQREELQNKLQDLQQKKRHMDDLLQELRALREARAQQLNNDGSVRDGSSLQSAQQTLQSAQEVLDTLDTTEKYSKLQDMRGRLEHLQEMVSDYQTDTAAALPLLSTAEVENNVAAGNTRVEQSRSSKGKNANKIKKTRIHKKDNISREHSNEYLARNLHDSRPPVADGIPGLQESGVLPLWEEEREVQEKLSKLKSTKDKLAKIQELLFTLQNTQMSGDPLSEGMTRQLLECMEDDADSLMQLPLSTGPNRAIEASGGKNQTPARSGDRTAAAAAAACDTRNSYADPQSFEDHAEVEHLLDEGAKLMEMQAQFLKLKQQFSVNHSGNAESTDRFTKSFVPMARASGGREKTRTFSESSSKSNQDASIPDRHQSTLKNAMQNLALQKMAGESDDRDSELPFSNQELWSEMRQRLILKEELRQQKRELEELMKKDQGKLNSRNRDNMSDNLSYSNKSEGLGGSFGGTEGMTAATWGGSTQGNPDEDQDDQNESQEENDAADDNDAYSSEEVGIMEPEVARRAQNHESFAARNDASAAQPCRNSSEPVSATERLATNNTASTMPKIVPEFQDARNFWEKSPQGLPLPQNWSNQPLRLPIKQIITSVEEPFEERAGASAPDFNSANLQQQALQFQHQIEQAHLLRQSLMRDQQNLSSLIHPTNNLNISSGSTPPDSFRPFFPEVLQQYSQQLQQQQLIINLNQCYHLQYLQQLEIQQLQRQLQQVLHLHSTSPLLPSDEAPRCSMSDEMASHPAPWLAPSPSTSQFAQCPPPIGPAETVVTSAHYPPTLMTQHSVTRGSETLNNQVAPGIRANNYWDNFRSYSRQNLLSAASGNKTNGGGGSSGAAAVSLNAISGNPQLHSAPLLPNRHLFPSQELLPERSALRSRNTQTSAPSAVASQTVSEHSVSPNQQGSTFPIPKLDLDRVTTTKVKQKKPKVNQEQQRTQRPPGVGAATQTPTEAFKPGQSGGGSGATTFLANTSCSSSAMSLGSSVRGGDVSFMSESHNQTFQGSNVAESDDLSDRTLFDTLRESIYSEVANLISQNESRPHFLIQMFQQLQTLNSDYQRQNALIAVHELAQNISEEGSPSTAPRRRRHGTIWIEPPANTTSEQTASESLMTSDDEEVRAHLFRSNKVPPRYDPFSLKLAESGQNRDSNFFPLSLAEVRTSTSTPPASSENPFASDSVADTVVSVTAKSKEVNQRKPLGHSSLGPDSSPARSASLPFHSASEGTSSSAHDQASEMSTSDIPYSGLNTSQLDDQIQAIMLEIIPFLKTHLDDMCSPKFLTYVRQLTLSLVTQRDEAGELTHFFRKQLSRILHDTLMKYSGRRLRECGEDLLVDMSEVLFNELAFLRLVQNMDSGTNVRARSARGSFQSMIQQTVASSSETSPQKVALNEATGGSLPLFLPSPSLAVARELATNTDATDADLNHVSRTEDDEVGQSRDDSMAANCDITAVEDDDQNSNRIPKNQPMLREGPTNERNLTPVFGPMGLVTLGSASPANEHRQEQGEVRELYGINFDASQLVENNREMDVETEAEGLEEDLAEADRSQSHPVVERVASGSGPANIAEMNGNNSSELSHAEATEDDQGEQQEGAYGESEPLANDENVAAAAETEQGLDEIPIKLRPLLQDLAQARLREDSTTDSVETELGDTANSVRDPEHQ